VPRSNRCCGEASFIPGGSKSTPARIIRGEDSVPKKILHHSRMYQEYWRPRGLSDAIRLTISLDATGTRHGVNLIRPSFGARV